MPHDIHVAPVSMFARFMHRGLVFSFEMTLPLVKNHHTILLFLLILLLLLLFNISKF